MYVDVTQFRRGSFVVDRSIDIYSFNKEIVEIGVNILV